MKWVQWLQCKNKNPFYTENPLKLLVFSKEFFQARRCETKTLK